MLAQAQRQVGQPGGPEEVAGTCAEMEAIDWGLAALARDSGAPDSNTPFVRCGRTVLLNAKHPYLTQLTRVCGRIPSLSGHSALRFCLEQGAFPQMSVEQREELLRLDLQERWWAAPCAWV